MGRPTVDLESLKDIIIDLYQHDTTASDIAKILQQEYNVTVTTRTIQRRLQKWHQSKRVRVIESQALKDRIQELLFQYC